MTFAELVGFTAPAATGALLFLVLDAPEPLGVPALATAGAVEGAVLGLAQAAVLQDYVRGLSRRRWTLLTAGAAALAWAIGMTPPAIGGRVPAWVLVVGAVVLAPVLLNAIGVAQWFELRRHVANAALWMPANALGWLLGLPAVFIAMAVVPGDAPAAAFALAGVLGAVVMAAVVALVTGVALIRLGVSGQRHNRSLVVA